MGNRQSGHEQPRCGKEAGVRLAQHRRREQGGQRRQQQGPQPGGADARRPDRGQQAERREEEGVLLPEGHTERGVEDQAT